MHDLKLALIPRDGLFFKDPRGWFTSASGRGRALGWPFPSSMRGVVRTAWGRSLEEADPDLRLDRNSWPERTREVRLHVLLPLRRKNSENWSPAHRMWPVPRDAFYQEGEEAVVRLDPVRGKVDVLGTLDGPPADALWWPDPEPGGKPSRSVPEWWEDEDFIAWLSGRTPKQAAKMGGSDLLALPRRVQIHVGIDPETLTHRESILFASETVETLDRDGAEWGIGLWTELPGPGDSLLSTPWTVGGKSRIAFPAPLGEAMFEPPARLLEAFDPGVPGLRLVTVTPAEFDQGWLPDGFELEHDRYLGRLPGVQDPVVLRAAFVDRPLHVSGWDVAGGRPKPTRRLVPPGSVFFFTRATGERFTPEEARALWLAHVGNHTEEGQGCVVPGVWYPRSTD